MNTAVSFGKAQKNQKSEKNHHPRTQGENIKRIAVNTAITAGTGAAVGAVGIGEVYKALASLVTIGVKKEIKDFKAMNLLQGSMGNEEVRRTSLKKTISEVKVFRKQILSFVENITPQMRGRAAVLGAVTAVVVGTAGSLVVHGLKDMFRTDKHK
jgi:hypothetical protein